MIVLFIVLMALPCFGTFTRSMDNKKTYKNAYRWTGKSKDYILDWALEVEEMLDGTTGFEYLYYIPTATSSAPTATEGVMFYDLTTGTVKYRNASEWISLTGLAAGTVGTLDQSYNAGYAIDVDETAVTMTVSDGDNNTALAINQDEATNDNDAVVITMGTGATGTAVEIDSVTNGTDIAGDNWSVNQAGVATLVGAIVGGSDIVLSEPATNDITLSAESDGILTIAATSKEDIDLDLVTANTLTLTSSTGVSDVVWGALDAHSGLASLAGDAGADFAISAANTGTYNLTVAQTGTGDNELTLSSAGTAANAVQLTASTGGVTATAATSIIGTSAAGVITLEATGGDIKLDSTDKSIMIDSGEASADDAITIVTTGAGSGIVITSLADIDMTTTGASDEDISITNTGGSILLSATEAAVNAISLQATAGGVDIDAIGAEAGDLTMNAADNMGITAADALTLTGTTTGVFTSPALTLGSITTTASTTIQSGTGDLALTSTDDISLTVNTTTSDNIIITNTPGTGEDAINIDATAGGIDIDFATAKNMAVTGGQFIFTSNEDVASAFSVVTDTGIAETITLVNTQGTATGAITLTTTAAGDIDINSGDDLTVDTTDDATITVGGDLSIAVTGTTTIDNSTVATIGINFTPFDATADDADGGGNSIPAGTRIVEITAVTNNADDWVALPVGVLGEKIAIVATVACELRTLASTTDEINELNCDGTKEYQLTAGDVVDLICVEAGARWMGVSHTKLGAAKTIVPD